MPGKAEKYEFGVRIAQLRQDKNWSQEELGFESGMARNTIQRIEDGAIPKVDKVVPLCSALEVTPNELFGYEEDLTFGLDPMLAASLREIAQAAKRNSPERQRMLAGMLKLQAELLK